MSDICCTHTSKPIIRNQEKGHFGGSVCLKESLYETLSEFTPYGTCQFFLGGPLDYKLWHPSSEDKIISQQYLESTGKNFYVHAPLIINLASEKKTSIGILRSALKDLTNMNAALVTHVGKVGSTEMIINNLDALDTKGSSLLLENGSGQGTEKGVDWKELRKIFEGTDTRVDLCIDTQHAFAAGLSTFENEKEVNKFFAKCDEFANRKGTREYSMPLLHLNDSKKEFGSRVDRHENLMEGCIWKDHPEGLCELVLRGLEDGVDFILETPNCGLDLETLVIIYEEGWD